MLVFLLSVPFYVLGAAGGRLPIATFLPTSAIMAFLPMIVALVLVYRESDAHNAIRFLGRAFDYRRIKGVGWILAALLLMPLVFVLDYCVLRLSGAAPLDATFPIATILAFLAMFFVGAVGEELGWQAYAFPRLRERRSAFAAGVLLGVIWALWHVIPYAQMGRSGDWIIWQCLGAIVMRVIIVWLFVNNGQSLFIAALFHTMINIPWGLFPSFGSYFDPFVMCVILSLLAGIIIALWGPATLARFRYAR